MSRLLAWVTGILGLPKRLMDEFTIESSEAGAIVTMAKGLPKRSTPYNQQSLAQISAELTRHSPLGLLDELQLQNQELLRTLQELRDRQAELAELHTRELDETNRGVVAMYSELDENAIELKRISELKTRFLSSMSHEFRSPLNTILNMTGFLLGGSTGELTAEQRKEIGYIRKAADDLSALVNDLLDLAKVEAGKAVIRPESFEVADLFEGLRETIKPLLTKGSVDLIVEEPVGVATLETDEAKVAQILRNFLSNAAKFTERGTIRLAAKAGPGDIIIFSVSDTGIGIALADQRRVFEEYSQVEGPVQKRVKGTGLGLPLSRKLAELLGGGVSVQSEPGVGSTFIAVIPRSYRAPDESDASPQSRWQPDPFRTPVLVVDDDPVDLLLYEKFLEGSCFQVLPAQTPGEARRILRQVRPTAILLDILLNAESGWSLMAELKGLTANADIPIFVVTLVNERDRALSLGAADFCLKPIDRDWILSRLNALQENRTPSTILIIDDAESDRYLLTGLLTAHGRFAIVEARSGEEGLRRAREQTPDVIFLDLNMKDMTGFDVLDRLKLEEGTKNIPVIINTSSDLGDEERRRLAPATAAILSKSPGTADESFATMRHALIQAGLSLRPAGKES